MKHFLSFLITLLPVLPLHAQLAQYAFRHESAPFIPLGQSGASYTRHSVVDDAVSPEKVGLPFSFRFGGKVVDSAGISENGFLWFGAAPGSSFFWPPLSAPLPPDVSGVVVAMGTDLHPHVHSLPATQIHSAVTGAAPDRVFVVEWRYTSRIDPLALDSAEDTLSFAIRLFETSGRVEIAYGEVGLSAVAVTYPKIGLRGPGADNYSLRAGSWQQTVPAALSGFLKLSRGFAPEAGQVFVWEPPLTAIAPETARAAPGTTATYTVYDVEGRKTGAK